MDQTIRIREGTSVDIDIVLYHRLHMFLEMGCENDEKMVASQQNSRDFFSKALNEGRYRAWFAETNSGKVVAGGGIVLTIRPGYPTHPDLQRAEILNMYTEPAFRRQGLARQLMLTMIAWCRKEGFSWVGLHASDAGRPLYEALGFKPTAEMRLNLK